MRKRKTRLKIVGQGIVTEHWKNGHWTFGGKDPISIWGSADKAIEHRRRFFESLGDSVEVVR